MGARLLPALSQFVIARALADWRYFLAEQRPLDLSINLPISFFDDPKSFDYLCRQLPDDPAFEGLILEVDAANQLGARTVAVGIENYADFCTARALGFDLVQGFLFAKPMGVQTFMRAIGPDPATVV